MKLTFTSKSPDEILKQNKTGVLNFQNLYSVYLFNSHQEFKGAIASPDNFIFPDGRILSFFLKTKQVRGPSFTRHFLQTQISNKQKHFFILPEIKDLELLIEKYPKLKNSKAHSPSYIKNSTFSEQEIESILEQIKKAKPTHIWICIGNPKQEILANQLYKKYLALYFNVGAATDFLLEKKKEVPLVFRRLGVEWLYRFVTDFKHSKHKVIKSLVGLQYIGKARTK